MGKRNRQLALGAGCATAMSLHGCVERTITITSEPAGALVYLNDREIGRTPVDVEFVHYGEYDVRLVLDGYEPQLTSGDANAPVWDLPGPDFVAEVLPLHFTSELNWHYVLEPVQDEPEALVDRARAIRSELESEPLTADEPTPTPAENTADAPAGG